MQQPGQEAPLPGFSRVESPVPMRATRVVFTFKVPAKLQAEVGDGVQSIGLVKLSADEEIQASRMGKANDTTMLELLKMSLRAVNGTAVSTGDATSDASLNRMDPKIRNLCVAAFSSIHNPKEGETKDFLDSVSMSTS